MNSKHRGKTSLVASLLVMLISVLMSSLASAQSNGTYGPVYPIEEPDMLEEITKTLKEKEKTGELKKLQNEAIKRSTESARNPAPVKGLTTTKTPRSFYYDPSIVAKQRILAPDGRVIVEKGQRANPLDKVALSKWLVFFDARDPAQLQRAQYYLAHSKGTAKLILTGGSYIDVQKKLKIPVFFDQQGVLTRKFGIKQVPAVVYQEGKKLRIDEVKP